MRCLELYCGIGGFAVAAEALTWQVAQAVDINQHAIDVYRHNFPHHSTIIGAVDSLPPERLQSVDADLWWMSPPCQPFTARGKQRDLADPRACSFVALLDQIGELRPLSVVLENVPGFANSVAAERLRATLTQSGYAWQECVLCPTQFGIPNRRRRFYLVASRLQEPCLPAVMTSPFELMDVLDCNPSTELEISNSLVDSYQGAMDIVNSTDPCAVTSCFTSAYGRSHVRSGSYLAQHGRVRRFAPHEVLRLLGFPCWFRLPSTLKNSTAWRLVGNSLSIPVVTHVLRSFIGESVHHAA